MPRFAEPVPAPAATKTAASAALRPRLRSAEPSRGALWHAIQLKAVRSEAPMPAPAPSRTDLPSALKAGVERLSGFAMSDVRVHRNSPEPAKLGALAYTKGSDIHLGPGQDAHLPHEAWHVVQQKAGRVHATMQLKGGVGINDDAGLESEADLMGAKASAPSAAPARAPFKDAPAAGGVVQCVLKYKNVAIHPLQTASDAVPDALAALDAAPIDYHIRDDWELTNHGVIHVVDGRSKYLLGELHGGGDWEDETRQWSSIPKMRESRKAFPGVPAKAKAKPSAAANAPAKAKAKKALPLENMHAYFMHVTLAAHGILNEFRPNPAARPSAPRLDDLIAFVDEMWSSVLLTEQKEGDLDLDKADHVALGEFILACNDTFKPRIVALLETAKKVRAEVQKSIERKAGAVQDFTAPVTAMIGEAKFIPELTRSLTAMLGIGPGSALAASIQAEAVSPAHVVLGASVANRVREMEMARNIKAAPPPLLVQVGDLHVEPLVALVPGTVGLRRDQMLAEVTALDLGPKLAAPVKPGPAKPAAKPAAGPAASTPAKAAAHAK